MHPWERGRRGCRGKPRHHQDPRVWVERGVQVPGSVGGRGRGRRGARCSTGRRGDKAPLGDRGRRRPGAATSRGAESGEPSGLERRADEEPRVIDKTEGEGVLGAEGTPGAQDLQDRAEQREAREGSEAGAPLGVMQELALGPQRSPKAPWKRRGCTPFC